MAAGDARGQREKQHAADEVVPLAGLVEFDAEGGTREEGSGTTGQICADDSSVSSCKKPRASSAI